MKHLKLFALLLALTSNAAAQTSYEAVNDELKKLIMTCDEAAQTSEDDNEDLTDWGSLVVNPDELHKDTLPINKILEERCLIEVRVNARGDLWLKSGLSNGFIDQRELRKNLVKVLLNPENNPHVPSKRVFHFQSYNPADTLQFAGRKFTGIEPYMILLQYNEAAPQETVSLVQEAIDGALEDVRAEFIKANFPGKADKKQTRLYQSIAAQAYPKILLVCNSTYIDFTPINLTPPEPTTPEILDIIKDDE